MSRKSKLYWRVKQNAKNCSYEDLSTLLFACEYELRSPGGGSHRWFEHPTCPPIHFPEHKPVGKVYVERALDILITCGCLDDIDI